MPLPCKRAGNCGVSQRRGERDGIEMGQAMCPSCNLKTWVGNGTVLPRESGLSGTYSRNSSCMYHVARGRRSCWTVLQWYCDAEGAGRTYGIAKHAASNECIAKVLRWMNDDHFSCNIVHWITTTQPRNSVFHYTSSRSGTDAEEGGEAPQNESYRYL